MLTPDTCIFLHPEKHHQRTCGNTKY